MKTQAEKTAFNKTKTVANTSSDMQDKRKSEVQFEDNRPEVVAQRKLRAMADNSPQASKVAQLQAIANGSSPEPVQKQGAEEEEILQGKFETIQKQEEEELLQGKFETIQKQEDEELLQGKFETIQKQGLDEEEIQAKSTIVQKKEDKPANNTGLPDTLKSGIENLSGLSLDDVKVHYNSAKPAQLQAHAFAQGADIHMAPGQEKHLPHEAWHVVQQKQGRVKPTKQLKGKVSVNDDAGLEKEADVMGGRALQAKSIDTKKKVNTTSNNLSMIQREAADVDAESGNLTGISNGASLLGINKTKVKYTTDNLETTGELVGIKMVADPIGRDHPQGSAPDKSASKNHIETFNQYDTYIRGHLLNGHIGGPGKAENLFPITAQANSLHYQQIESIVENWVNTNGYYVYYEVKVGNRKDQKGYAEFHCKAYPVDATGKPTKTGVKAIIKSEPGGSTSKQSEVATNNKNAIDQDKQLGGVVEYQRGKFPVGYVDIAEIDPTLEAKLEQDNKTKGKYGGTLLEDKLNALGFSDDAIENIILAYITEDPAVWQDTTKGAWNSWMKKLKNNYQ